MASHHVAVAKASLVAACLQKDVTKLGREDVDHFHTLLEKCLLQCSPHNVQSCKKWLIINIVPSLHRTTALGKYLASICKHITPNTSTLTGRKAPPSRQRLHILYVINDLLHHAAYHVKEPELGANLAKGLEPVISDLFLTTVGSCKKRVSARVGVLLQSWTANKYLAADSLQNIAMAMATGKTFTIPDAPVSSPGLRKELPYIMPAFHGDPSMPFYDLPAANFMPHIIPNSPAPMRPEQISALQLSAGPADENLARAVKSFLKEVDRLEDPYGGLEDEGIVADIDELGHASYRNEDDELVGDTYYGWSRNFCEKMKGRGRRSSRHSEQSRSSSPNLKRRKRSPSRSLSRSRSSSRSRRYSRSYSPEVDRSRFNGATHLSPSNYPAGSAKHTSPDSSAPSNFPPPRPGQNSMQFPSRPSGWSGPWPPPPPPGYMSAGTPHMQFPPPPPPPPLPPPPPGSQHYLF